MPPTVSPLQGAISTGLFWLLALLPGLLHPLLLYVYFVRFGERKKVVAGLLNRNAEPGAGERRRLVSMRQKQKDEWENRLDLNRRSYIFPVVIASLISIAAAVVMLAVSVKTNELRLPPALRDYLRQAAPAAVAGFAGAYVWGLYDFVDRFRTFSLPAGALHIIWFRLLLGPVLGQYAQQLIVKDFAPVLVFALSSIPVPAILKWLQDTATQRFGMTGPAAAVPPKWELVQGLTPDMISRLTEIGVTSVAHLGNQAPVELLRRTNIEWLNVLDMMDQAYLANYVDDAISKLRARGIRGSIEMAILWERAESKDPEDQKAATALFQAIAPDLGKDDASARNLARNLAEDPQVQRIWSLWWEGDSDTQQPKTDANSGRPTDFPQAPLPPPPEKSDTVTAGH